ncbi:P-loop containing nucleoside triphosphate hydrolase protein [Catenaria anguillulae PL171]|uniref:p-loop containing nucleoside triphosphate hydrolase protein n=1 Tax=Catenaria anguillulae PL171 TaxID=765915 RepID=A0A1Y2HJ64_9FUNG|nr:P-loop containing nucleoside triphosphate hydrolase protein [Catenaria anguillulae PL171]
MNQAPKARKIKSDPASLAHEAYRLLQQVAAARHKRLVIALAGCPGNGKSTVAQALAAAVNDVAMKEGGCECAIAVSMDGFHYPKAILQTFVDPMLAHARRGAPFTFDAPAYLASISSLATATASGDILWPDFDHAAGDPVANATRITSNHTIVIVEGLYVLSSACADIKPKSSSGQLSHLMPQPEWSQAASLVHERWWVEVSPGEVAETRLAERHVRTGLAKDMDSARARIQGNDALNAKWVIASIDWNGVHVIVDNS